MKATLFGGISRDEYDAMAGVRKSILWEGMKSAAHMRYAMDNPKEPTEQMALGTLVHALVLEPGTVDDRFVVCPKVDRRTKEGKAAWAKFCADAEGKTVVTADQMGPGRAMAESLMAISDLSDLLQAPGGLAESAIQWTDPETGVLCKCLMDYAVPELVVPVVLDLKTCRDATVHGFRNAVAEYGYDVQSAFYGDALRLLTGRQPVFLFFAVESSPPYIARRYVLSQRAISWGRMKYQHLLRIYKECSEANDWPGQNEDYDELDLPAWAEKIG